MALSANPEPAMASLRPGIPRFGGYLRLLLIALAVYAGVLAALAWVTDAKSVYGDMRGAPALAVLHGVSVYQIGLKGIAFCVPYGPLTYLVYLPAALWREPQYFFLAACLISFVIYCGPLFIFCWHIRKVSKDAFWVSLLLVNCFVLFTFYSPSLHVAMSLASDGPALGFAGMACAIMFFYDGRRPWLDCALTAAFTCCAIFTKQNTGALVLVLPLYSYLIWGRRTAMRLCLCLGAGALITVGLTAAVYGDLRAVYFNDVVMLSRFPLEWNRFPGAVQELTEQSALLIFGLGCLMLLPGSNGRALIKDLNRKELGRVVIFAAMALFMIPASVLGRIFLGGAANALSPALYFALLELLTFAYVFLAERAPDARTDSTVLTVLFLFATVLVPLLARNFAPFSLRSAVRASSSEIAYRYARRHPGEIYFPFNQVSVYYAEHKFYHADWGIENLVPGKVPFSKLEILRYIPPNARYMAYPPDAAPKDWLQPYLSPSRKRVEVPELQDFSVFELER